MAKILVTGGAGFIGSHIVENFHETDEVIVLDNLRSGFKKNIEPFNVKFVHGSVTDALLVKKITKGVDYIFHLAALVSVPESMAAAPLTVSINVNGTLNLLEAAREHGVKKIVLSSSAAIYGDNPVVPKVETMLPEPKSPYAITKLDGEYYFKMYSEEFGVPTVCLRYFNVFGPRQDPNSQYAAAVPIFIDRALKNKDIIIYGDGEQTRDFIFVKDIVKANAFVAQNPEANGVYNVARGGRITINELAKKIISITGSKSSIRYAAERAGDVKHSQADVSRLRSLGISPDFDLEEGLKATIEFFSR
ncbi:dTDP-glucose 4,6-dehydratase [candidate division KSB1 bacterium 4484_87]|nr:MAG: dTDP-glucose 4,6-dehydratase [candidate division KSB1 bacterium 4484_87]